jgi:hypothetical protein
MWAWTVWLARQGAMGGALLGAVYGALAPLCLVVLTNLGLATWPFFFASFEMVTLLNLLAGAIFGGGLGLLLAWGAGVLGVLVTRLIGFCSPGLVQAGSVALGTLGTALVCFGISLPGAFRADWQSNTWTLAGWLLGLGVPALGGAVWAWHVSHHPRALAFVPQA